LLSLKTIEDAYQAILEAKEKMLRKKSQRNRGRSVVRGRGTTKPRVQQHQHEIGSSSSRPPQRGYFNRGKFAPRGRGRGRDVRCYTCGEWGHVSWDYPHNKPTSQRNVLGPYNTSDYPINIVFIPLIYIVVPLLPPCCYFCAP